MSPGSLVVRWRGGDVIVAPGQTVDIGRDPENDVALSSSAVSRRHGRIRFAEGVWTYSDLGSTQGSFLDGEPVTTLALAGPTTLTLGVGAQAVTIDLQPSGTGGAGEEPTRAGRGRVPPTAVPDGARPGGRLDPDVAQGATVVRPRKNEGAPLRVRAGEEVRVLRPGQRLAVGRDHTNDLVLDEDCVSRHHLVVERSPTAQQWVLRDVGSSAGTWLGSTRVREQSLTGIQSFRLGDQDDGPQLVTESPDPGSGRRRVNWLLVGSVAAVVVLVAALGTVLGIKKLSGVSDDTLAKASMRLDITSASGAESWGSGTLIDRDRGLILTNAHVAAPTSAGFAVNQGSLSDEQEPAQKIEVSVTDGLDHSAEKKFLGTVVAADGYLDLAIVKITQTESGALVERSDLEQLTALSIGSSRRSRTGDQVRVVGYPLVSYSRAPTLTEGVVSGVQTDLRLRSNRAYVNTDARINHGNSGGVVADSRGRLIGVPTLVLGQAEPGYQLFSYRPVELALPMLKAVQQGRKYTSPWTSPAPQTARVTNATLVSPTQSEVAQGCVEGQQQSGLVSIGITYTGFPDGAHTDLVAELRRTDPATGKQVVVSKATTTTAYPTRLAGAGCITLTFAPLDANTPLGPGTYTLEVGLGSTMAVIFTSTYTKTS